MKTDWLTDIKTGHITFSMNDAPIQEKQTIIIQPPQIKKEKSSNTPWIEIKGEAIDPDKGIRLSLDWNTAFITYLKQNGINGTDEDQIIQKYITLLYQEIMEQMNEAGQSEFE